MRHRMPIFLSQGLELLEGVRIAARTRGWSPDPIPYRVTCASQDPHDLAPSTRWRAKTIITTELGDRV